jgi:Ca2+-binding EF-hand superfamily protein
VVAAVGLMQLDSMLRGMAPLVEAFHAASAEGRGQLDLQGFAAFCGALGRGAADEEVAQAFGALDPEGRGLVPFEAVVAAFR